MNSGENAGAYTLLAIVLAAVVVVVILATTTNVLGFGTNTAGGSGAANAVANGAGGAGCTTCRAPSFAPPAAATNGTGATLVQADPSSFVMSSAGQQFAQQAAAGWAPTMQQAPAPQAMPAASALPVTPTLPGQAFSGEVPGAISTRQLADFAKMNGASLVPSSGSTVPLHVIDGADVQGLGCGNADNIMSSYAPKRSQLLFAANYGLQCSKGAQINARSARSRILGQGTLLREPAPIPRGHGGVSFLDSELRHQAMEQNMPPRAVCV